MYEKNPEEWVSQYQVVVEEEGEEEESSASWEHSQHALMLQSCHITTSMLLITQRLQGANYCTYGNICDGIWTLKCQETVTNRMDDVHFSDQVYKFF